MKELLEQHVKSIYIDKDKKFLFFFLDDRIFSFYGLLYEMETYKIWETSEVMYTTCVDAIKIDGNPLPGIIKSMEVKIPCEMHSKNCKCPSRTEYFKSYCLKTETGSLTIDIRLTDLEYFYLCTRHAMIESHGYKELSLNESLLPFYVSDEKEIELQEWKG